MRVLVLLLGFLPGIVSAAGFEVRSGEHDGYSRLVVYFDRARPWDVVATETGYELLVPDSTLGFETGAVFDFIPRSRLAAARSLGDRLALDLECDCPLRVFAYRPDIAVIDIFTEQPDAGSVADSRILQPWQEPEAPAETASVAQVPLDATESPATQSGAALPHWQDRAGVRPRAGQVLGFSAPGAPSDQRLDHAALVAGIAQAASHGLVTLSEPGERGTPADFPVVAGLRLPGSQVNVRDGLLRGETATRDDFQPDTCLPGELFQVYTWGDAEAPASTVLSEMRATTAIGPAGTDDAIAILRSYIYLGFGSEAAELVRTYRMSEDEERAYLALSGIVDHPGAADPNPLADQRLCDSPAALWALVAGHGVPALPVPLDTDRILRDFQRLPPWLRVQLGETAAENFAALGDTVASEAVRASVARARAAAVQQDEDTEAAQADAEAILAGTDADVPSDRTRRMRAAQSALAAHDRAHPLPDDAREEIMALVLETRGSEDSVALMMQFADFVSEPDDILAAEHLLTVLGRSRFGNRYPLRAGWNALLDAAVAQASHDLFLGFLGRNQRQFSRMPPDRAIANAAVARLLATGLPESAADVARALDAAPPLLQRQTGSAAGDATIETGGPSASGTRAAARREEASEKPRADATDLLALRGLLTPDEAPRPQPAIAGTLTAPLDALRASETAVEVLDRVLATRPGGG